ncbi:MAG: DUF2116 family Zn-ribbon domain-containing protein [Candidatus Thermoplasmatota archaeon]
MSPVPPPTIAPPVTDLLVHKHCEACGTSIGIEGRVCSEACVAKFDEAVRTRRRSVYIFVGLMAIMLLFGLYGTKLFGA